MRRNAVAAFIAIMSLTSCSLSPQLPVRIGNSLEDDEKAAMATLTRVTDALVAGDKTSLKTLFSKQALSQASDFDSEADALLGFFSGTIHSQELFGEPSSGESIDGPSRTYEMDAFYHVNTDKNRYSFMIINVTADTTHPENVGISSLRVIRTKDEDRLFVSIDDMRIPGIWCRPDA